MKDTTIKLILALEILGSIIVGIGEYLLHAYYGLLAIPFLLALTGTITEMSGKVICPRTPGGTPMCFISLGFCTVLIALKFFSF